MWFTEFAGNKIGKISKADHTSPRLAYSCCNLAPGGVFTEYNTSGWPDQIAQGPDGNMYVDGSADVSVTAVFRWFTQTQPDKACRLSVGTGSIQEFDAGVAGRLSSLTAGHDGEIVTTW